MDGLEARHLVAETRHQLAHKVEEFGRVVDDRDACHGADSDASIRCRTADPRIESVQAKGAVPKDGCATRVWVSMRLWDNHAAAKCRQASPVAAESATPDLDLGLEQLADRVECRPGALD